MSSANFDLVVIGSGPAGQKAALSGAKLGKRVALIDRREMIGGVCIHTGTIPSKAIREAVLHLTAFNERSMYGDSYAVKHDITMSDLLYRCNHTIRNECDVVHNQMRRNGVTLFYGRAKFVSERRVRIMRHDRGVEDTLELESDRFLIAVGTEPARPASVPFTPGKIIDSNELLTLRELPRSMIIVGGGVIGTEYASMLSAVGVKVTLIESRPRLMEFLDEEISELLQLRLREMGVRLKLGESVAKIDLDDGVVEVTTKSGKVISADTLLYSIGRQGATAGLGLEATGLTADERGRLKVNECYQTAASHIYAAGDVIGFPALAATSMEQGRLAAAHMFHLLSEPPQTLFPYGIYTIPEISMVGASEQSLTAQGVPYECGIARYREIARGHLISDPNGMLKLIFHQESRRLLGVHALGTGATELIHIGQTCMAAGLPIDYFVETVFNYPTLAECYKVAAQDGINRVRPPKSMTLEHHVEQHPEEPVPVSGLLDDAVKSQAA
ncbi:MAG TPA: Si-specific NAD(P)(+) transhydrogenase [Tepidisphaeraceae bacterium]|nr:Si-specific NAD(P)(+) transhydrogenase [Tepidisphaeraceae bacterium]